MCIVCKAKELAVLQVETVEALAESVGALLAVLDRVKATGFVLGDAEAAAMARAVALLRADPSPATDSAASGLADAPEGIPPALWASLPPDVQAQLAEAIVMGAKLQIVSVEDIMQELEPNSTTKH